MVDAGCEKTDSPFVTAYPDSGPCDDSEPIRAATGADAMGHYAVTCEPQPLDQPGCKGVPNDSWARCALRRCEAKVSYPEGCSVFLPHENPYYPGSPQSCRCMLVPGSDKLSWVCPI